MSNDFRGAKTGTAYVLPRQFNHQLEACANCYTVGNL